MGKANAKAIEMAADFKKKAAKKYGIKKVLLFGSQATGKSRKDSDIDLIVVSERIKKKSEFMSSMIQEWHLVQGKRHPVDFLCYTPKEFKAKSKGITIVKQAVEEGIEV